MDDDRKYRHHGYQDSGGRDRRGTDRPRQNGPRPPIDVTGPRLPRLVEAVAASRCYNCGTALPRGMDFKSNCPKCAAALHCCKQCVHFDTATRFQCRKPILVRIAQKDAANECAMFSARVTVARDAAPAGPPVVTAMESPRSASDARAAFDSLFKK